VIVVWSARAKAIVIDVATAAGDSVTSTYAFIDEAHAVIDVSDLTPDTAYVVTIVTDDNVRLVHRVRTAPAPDATRAVRICVSADVDPLPDFATDLTAHVVAAAPELYVSLGDFPYTDNGPPAQDVLTYRQRYADCFTDPQIRRLLENVAVRGIYDDHEFRNNWDAMFASVEAARYAAAMQVWDELFPVRGTPGDVRYRSWRWGAHLELFMLDCRRYRSANVDPDGADKTMLGATQRDWLVTAVTGSTAAFKVVLTSVPLDYGDGVDHWAGFTHEREALLDALAGVYGLLFISGDQHWFADQLHAHRIREIQVGPLARGIGTPTVVSPNVLFRAPRYNAALLDVDATTLTVSALADNGEVFYKQTLSIADLTPTPAR
jgi:alkaline phosphatase D